MNDYERMEKVDTQILLDAWRSRRRMFHMVKSARLFSRGVSIDDIHGIMKNSERSYPITPEDTNAESLDRFAEFMLNEQRGFERYYEEYENKWFMYRDLFEKSDKRAVLRHYFGKRLSEVLVRYPWL